MPDCLCSFCVCYQSNRFNGDQWRWWWLQCTFCGFLIYFLIPTTRCRLFFCNFYVAETSWFFCHRIALFSCEIINKYKPFSTGHCDVYSTVVYMFDCDCDDEDCDVTVGDVLSGLAIDSASPWLPVRVDSEMWRVREGGSGLIVQ